MYLSLLLLLQAPAQQPAAPPPPAAPVRPASPIAKVQVEPGDVAIQAGDTIRLRAVALDSSGRAIPGATTKWFQSNGHFEGSVTPEGLVTAGASGAMRVAAVTSVAGSKPTTTFTRITILPPPAARIVVTPSIKRLYVGQSITLTGVPYAANNDRRYDVISWESDAPGTAAVSAQGRVTAVKPGRATITARAGRASEAIPIVVEANATATLKLSPVDTAVRTGDVVRLTLVARNAAGKPLADVVPEFLVSGGGAEVDAAGDFVAAEPGSYRVVATFAGRSADAVINVRPRDVVRPTVVVGRLPVSEFFTSEFWLHPDGQHGYIGTLGDRIYAVDLSNPAKPVITDSVMVDARVINDVMTTEDGKFGVMTREGASSRKNGIVVLSFEDPAHPKQVAEFTETVTGGVHSTFIYKGYVYLTDDATGSMRVIDLRDPYHPTQVARWETPRTEAGRTLHDIDVQDGLAYLSYWNDGLVILDVGNGVKGGSPENPQFVSQLKYDLNALYRDVEAVGGPGFIRGTHTAWRSGQYVFVGDEVFSAKPTGIGPLGLGRAYGRLHVVDVSDITAPRIVAWYEPKDGGTHNVWVAGDTLYLGDYQGGLRILDISGEAAGRPPGAGAGNRPCGHRRRGREAAECAAGLGAIYRNGQIYVPDVNSGLWVVKVQGSEAAVP